MNLAQFHFNRLRTIARTTIARRRQAVRNWWWKHRNTPKPYARKTPITGVRGDWYKTRLSAAVTRWAVWLSARQERREERWMQEGYDEAKGIQRPQLNVWDRLRRLFR